MFTMTDSGTSGGSKFESLSHLWAFAHLLDLSAAAFLTSSVLAGLGCHTQIPQTGGLLLTVLEASSPRSRSQPIRFLERASFLACTWLLSC